MGQNYKTVTKATESEVVIERSRFITLVAPCATEEAARAILLERKKQHYSATHNCYAYITDGGKYSKFSDDGEPGGTAGMPIMSALNSSGLIDTIVIVTRYFGGIKLGAGGLTRAYLRCAAEGLKAAQVKTYDLANKIIINLSYDEYQTFLRMKNAGDYKVADTTYADAVTLVVMVKSGAIGRFSLVFADTFAGRVSFEEAGEEFFSFE